MKKVLLIDDEPLARGIAREFLAEFTDIEIVAECDNGFDGVKAILHHRPDLVILDIQMPRINGFEMLEMLEEMPAVIFATAFDEYALKAFEANAVDYLLKPFSKERFAAAIKKWLAQQNSPVDAGLRKILNSTERQPEVNERIVVRRNGEIHIIPVQDIVYMEAFDDYVKIFTPKDYFLKKKTMSFYEQTLDPSMFFRAHRSYLINLKELTRVEPLEKNSYVALLKNGQRIPLSRTSYSKLKDTLGL